MRQKLVLTIMLTAAVAIPAADALASFQAAELVYYPIAARNNGLNGSKWYTDITIMNVDEVAVDIAIFMMTTGNQNNAPLMDTREFALGPREAEGWGKEVAELGEIPPGGSVELVNLVENHFWDVWEYEPDDPENPDPLSGGLVIFAYEAGTVDLEAGPTYRNVVVQGRNYTAAEVCLPNEDTEEEDDCIVTPTTYGHTVLGVPWYNTADPGDHASNEERDLAYQVLVGGIDNEHYRFNLGLFNCSDALTTLALQIEAIGPDGNLLVNAEEVDAARTYVLEPLGHIQINDMTNALMQLGHEDNFSVRVRILSWSTQAQETIPALTIYGTVVSNTSNDAIYIAPSFGEPYPIECVWGVPSVIDQSADFEAQQALARIERASHLPLQIPKR